MGHFMNSLTWLGILFCLSQSAFFSGLNLALFSISRLRLEIDAEGGNPNARRLLALRHDSNFALTTILWGNVGINVLLTLLSNSVLTGLGSFFFSTVFITFFGEIFPQAYFSRHALRVGARLAPVLRFYQVLLFPVAKPTAMFLDAWLGREGVHLFREQDFRQLISKHVEAKNAEVSRLEGRGALNFLDIDDIPVGQEGEPLHPASILTLPCPNGRPKLPVFNRTGQDPFLKRIHESGRKWVVIIDEDGIPRAVLDAHRFLRGALFDGDAFRPDAHWHRPIVLTDETTPLGQVLGQMHVQPQHPEDDVIDNDLILVWSDSNRIITGADLLGRLMRGIARSGTTKWSESTKNTE
jgi:CBS domain containing-hemolysin-like protein